MFNIVDKFGLEKSIIGLGALVNFTVAFISTCVSVAIPVMAKDLAMNNIMQNWVATLFLLLIAAFSIPFGKICGKYGLKKSLFIGLIIILIGAFASALSFSGYMLLFFRAFQGVGAALTNVASMALVVMAVSPNKRGRALGINIMSVYIGLSLSPVLSGILTTNLGWPSIFYITVPLIIISLFLTYSIKEEWLSYENASIDKFGSIVYILGIILFIYGFSSINSLIGIISIIIGLILLILFAVIELKIEEPIFDVRLFKNSEFALSNLASMISYIATFVITFVLNYHFQYILGMDSQTAGLYLIMTPLVMAILSPISGTLSDKVKPHYLASLGMFFVAVAIGILCFLNETTPIYLIIIAMILQGLGYGLFASPNNNIIMSSVPPKDTSSASASLSAVRVIGQTMSLGMLTVIFAFIMGNVPMIPKYYPLLMESSRIACIIAVIACVIAIFASIVGINSNSSKDS